VRVYLTIKEGKLVAETNDEEVVVTRENLVTLFEDENVFALCSSSLDHPEEYTEDKEVISLCKLIRSA